MNLAKKTYLSMAMSVAMAGIGAPAYVGAVTLSQDLIGDVGIVPYYTMREGWTTDFNIVNTGNNTVAAKVRFHEGRNSREVLDFIVVLSPWDQINFYAVEDPVLGPVIRFPGTNSERTCVVPIPNGRLPKVDGVGGTLPFSAVDFRTSTSKDADGYLPPNGTPTIDRVREGYMTVIEMGVSREDGVGTVGYNSNHDHLDCVAVENAFRVANIVPTYNEFDRNQNNLKVGYSLTNVNRGTQGSDSATMLANFATDRSSIAHTATSVLAGGSVLQEAVAALEAAERAQTAAEAEVARLEDVGDELNPPCDLANVPAGCPVPLQNSYTAAKLAVTNAQIAVAAAKVDVAAATPGVLGAPRNLISAQDGNALSFADYERAPDLDSGDFFAYWFVDGSYRDFDNYNQLPDAINLPFGLWAGLYPRSVDAVTALLMKSDAINTWALNDVTGAHSDLVYTAPTKRFYTDWKGVYAKDPMLNGISPILAAAVANFGGGWPPFGNQFSPDGQSCDTVGVAMFNNDEIGPRDPVLPSPSPNVAFCWEVNVLHTAAASVLGSKLGERLDPNVIVDAATAPERYNGWVDVLMWVNAHNYHPALPVLNLTIPNIPATWPLDEIVQVGMPYIGFNFSERDLGNPANAYSGLTPHSYMRNWDKRNLVGGTITLEDLGLYGPVLLESIGSWFETNPILPINNQNP